MVTKHPIITLTTDFGDSDGFPAAMKAVILRSHPTARVVDVTHHVPRHDVAHAAFVLGQVAPHFPNETVHVAVVDPGVGGAREALALRSPTGGVFIGPDNGVFTHVLARELACGDLRADAEYLQPLRISIPARWRAVDIGRGPHVQGRPSRTFHGRDIFAPAAARVASGVALFDLGDEIHDLVVLNAWPPIHTSEGILGHIQYVDRFGNMATNLRGDEIPPTAAGVTIHGRGVPGPFSSYQEASGVGCIVASHGFLEIFVTGGNAAAELKGAVGDLVNVRV